VAYVFRQNREDNNTGASAMGQSSQGAAGTRAEKRVGVDESGGANTAMPGGGGMAAPKAPSDFTKTKNAGAGAILQRNRGVSQDSAVRRVAGDSVRALEGNLGDLGNRQNQYFTQGRQGIAETSAGLTDDQVREGLRSGKTTDLSSRLSAKPVQVKDFDPGTFKPIEATDYLRSGDVSNLIGKQSKSSYTSGMGALDNLAFNRSGAGRQVRQQVGGMQSDFRGQLEKALGTEGASAVLKREAEAANQGMVTGLRGQIENIAKGITGTLGGRRKEAETKNAATLAAERAARQGDIRGIVDEYKNRILSEKAKGNMRPMDYEALEDKLNTYVGDGSGLDRFISASNPELSENMFLADDEVSMLNNAAGLLGSGQIYQRGNAGAPAAKLNADALRKELDALLNPGLQAGAAERLANEKASAARAAGKATTAAVKAGNTNQATKAMTGGNEGVTGGGTTVPKQNTPVPQSNESAIRGMLRQVLPAGLTAPTSTDSRAMFGPGGILQTTGPTAFSAENAGKPIEAKPTGAGLGVGNIQFGPMTLPGDKPKAAPKPAAKPKTPQQQAQAQQQAALQILKRLGR